MAADLRLRRGRMGRFMADVPLPQERRTASVAIKTRMTLKGKRASIATVFELAGNNFARGPRSTKLTAMSKERFTERQADVRDSAARLTEAAAQPESDLVRDATIQRFEFTFEVVWKTLKLYLERQGHECGGPRQTLKKAFAENLIFTPEHADVWLQMLDDRNLTSHAYDEELARQIYGHIVGDYTSLLAGMADKIQTLEWD